MTTSTFDRPTTRPNIDSSSSRPRYFPVSRAITTPVSLLPSVGERSVPHRMIKDKTSKTVPELVNTMTVQNSVDLSTFSQCSSQMQSLSVVSTFRSDFIFPNSYANIFSFQFVC